MKSMHADPRLLPKAVCCAQDSLTTAVANLPQLWRIYRLSCNVLFPSMWGLVIVPVNSACGKQDMQLAYCSIMPTQPFSLGTLVYGLQICAAKLSRISKAQIAGGGSASSVKMRETCEIEWQPAAQRAHRRLASP